MFICFFLFVLKSAVTAAELPKKAVKLMTVNIAHIYPFSAIAFILTV